MSDDDRGDARSGGYRLPPDRYDDDDRRHGWSRGSLRYEVGDRSDDRGWYGDPRGHAEASRRGWESRRDYDEDDRGCRYSRSDYDDDRRPRYSDRHDDGRGYGGSSWSGDSDGHAEAARRGWRDH